MQEEALVRWFDEIGMEDVPLVGGKNASLGEMYRELKDQGVRVPDGFAITAEAYRLFLSKSGCEAQDRGALKGWTPVTSRTCALAARRSGGSSSKPPCRPGFGRRSWPPTSASAGGMGRTPTSPCGAAPPPRTCPTRASPASRRPISTCRACRRCWTPASAASPRSSPTAPSATAWTRASITSQIAPVASACSAWCAPISACSGVMFTIDTETGFRDAVLINAAYGLGENVVQGSVNPDEYCVFKPTLQARASGPILQKTVGSKEFKLVYDVGGGKMVKNVPVPPDDRARFAIDRRRDAAARALGLRHRGPLLRQARPAARRWTSNGPRTARTGELFIVQARPETVQSRKRSRRAARSTSSSERGTVLATGRSVGEKIARGRCGSSRTSSIIGQFQRGRGAGHRQDRPRLGADHEEGGRHRHQSRRPDLPRRHRQPRARRARHRRHRAGHRGAARRPDGHRELRRGRHRLRLRGRAAVRGRDARTSSDLGRPAHQGHDERRPTPRRPSALSFIPNDGVGLARDGVHHHDLHQDPPAGAGRLRPARRPGGQGRDRRG